MEKREFIRRCHVCSRFHESETEVLKCEGCGKAFVPLETFERIRTQALQLAERNGWGIQEAQEERFSINPLQGLIVFW